MNLAECVEHLRYQTMMVISLNGDYDTIQYPSKASIKTLRSNPGIVLGIFKPGTTLHQLQTALLYQDRI